MSIPLSPEQRAQKWGTFAKIAAVGVVGFIVAPYVFTAITGIIGLTVAGALVLGTWMALPAIGDAAKNMRLKLIKAEAARNPIETMESELLRRSHALNERKNKIETLNGKTQRFGSQLSDFIRQFPRDAAQFQLIYDKMQELLARSKEQWRAAHSALKEYEGEITRAKAKWAMALAAADLRQDAGQMEEEFLAKLRVETAIEAVELGMSDAFAQLDTLLLETESVELKPDRIHSSAQETQPTSRTERQKIS